MVIDYGQYFVSVPIRHKFTVTARTSLRSVSRYSDLTPRTFAGPVPSRKRLVMRASGRILAVVLAGLSNLYLPGFAAAQQSDQLLAERVLGSQWKQLSRRAGMIFAGTVLNVAAPDASTNRASAGAPPAVELRFRVDQPIVGVESGQILTIHEWSGAWSMHRPMSNGQHILLFLYPRSQLGLTSPVGGSLGQVVLDSSGTYVSKNELPARQAAFLRSDKKTVTQSVTVVQLERAIRRAREE
jgi:hypothetical protein